MSRSFHSLLEAAFERYGKADAELLRLKRGLKRCENGKESRCCYGDDPETICDRCTARFGTYDQRRYAKKERVAALRQMRGLWARKVMDGEKDASV